MTEDHLHLHGQPGGNGKEENGRQRSGDSGGDDGRLELEQVIAEENGQGKDFSSQLVQHPELHSQFMPGLRWIGQESFKQRHYFTLSLLSCNFKGSFSL